MRESTTKEEFEDCDSLQLEMEVFFLLENFFEE